MGGLLSNPATKFPWWFDTPFHHKFPYFLPCFVAALIAFAGCIYGYFYLGEVRKQYISPLLQCSCTVQTHPNLQRDRKEDIQMSERRDGSFEKPAEPASVSQLLSIPVVRALCLSGAGLSFM